MTSCAITNSSGPSTIEANQHLLMSSDNNMSNIAPNKPFSLNRTGSEAMSGKNKWKQGKVASCSSSKTQN